MISYQVELSLGLEEFQSILEDSGLAVRRPMEDLNFSSA
jgi:hypothetical protein